MRALTIRQPYADAIVHVDHPRWGRKRVENRSWPVPKQAVGGRILIHAGKSGDRAAVLAGILPGPDVRGAIIGLATIVDCHLAGAMCRIKHVDGCGPFGEPDVWHWTLRNVVALPTPVPAIGRLGLWTPAPDVLAAVAEQLSALTA